MASTIVGRVTDRLGHAMSRDRAWAHPAAGFRSEQNATIPLDLEHRGQPVGLVEHLERSGGGLWAVATLYDVELDQDAAASFSGLIDARPDGSDALLLALSLTETPAQIATLPVTVLAGSLADGARRTWALDGLERQLVDHALERLRDRRAGKPIVIQDPPAKLERIGDGMAIYDGELVDLSPSRAARRRAGGPLLYRKGTILAVEGRPVQRQ